MPLLYFLFLVTKTKHNKMPGNAERYQKERFHQTRQFIGDINTSMVV